MKKLSMERDINMKGMCPHCNGTPYQFTAAVNVHAFQSSAMGLLSRKIRPHDKVGTAAELNAGMCAQSYQIVFPGIGQNVPRKMFALELHINCVLVESGPGIVSGHGRITHSRTW
jgi:hypothetical protein